MIEKGQKLMKRYNKRTHVDPIKKDSILLFGEQVPLEDFYKQYNNNKKSKNLPVSKQSLSLLKEILEEYVTPIFDLYSKKL